MKVLHTSDWHVGRTLYGRKRHAEFERFLEWLLDIVRTHQVDVLLVSGDLFDTPTPSNRSQEIYYRFLNRVSTSCCRHVVIIGGNHDSPSFLNAPKALLKAVNIHVVGAALDPPEDEVVCLKDGSGSLEAIVCAVPYLRDRDIRSVTAEESMEDKAAALIKGIHSHYSRVIDKAAGIAQANGNVPVIGMGHLFAAGARTVEGDGVRTLHVGSLSQVGADVFKQGFDYIALGHLHVPQQVDKKEHIRYSGSPIPMGFGEAGHKKQVVIVRFKGKQPVIEPVPVPCFQQLKRITGSMEDILGAIASLKQEKSGAWLEVEYTGQSMVPDLKQQVEAAVKGSNLDICRIRNRMLIRRLAEQDRDSRTLEDLDVHEVFERVLDANRIKGKDRDDLTATYQEAVRAVQEADTRAD